MDSYLCLDAVPNLFGLFDTTIAPTLFYYSYIPIIFISLFFSFFVLFKNRSLQSKLLLVVAVIFSIWTINEIITWIAVDSWLVHFGWQLSALLQLAVVLSVVYFVYVFLFKKHPLFSSLLTTFILISPILVTLPTTLNITNFDLTECQGYNGPIWYYIYGLEILATLFAIFLCIKKYVSTKNIDEKKQAMFLGFGTALLLGLFVETNIAGDWTLVYEFNLFGPLGMALFIVFISYLIVKYHTFNIKLMGTQALVVALWIALCSTLFIRTIENARVVIAFTLILFLIVGIFLIRSVKREVQQREKIEKLAKELGEANEKLKELDQLKSEFLSLATHQLRSPLTAIKGYSAMLVDGDFGILPPKATDAARTVMQSCQNLINIVEDFLNISRIEQGRMVYEKTIFNLGELVNEVIKEIKPNIDKTGLAFELTIPRNISTQVNADRGKIKQVIGNIIDNAVKYTVHGSIKVSVSTDKSLVKVAVKDSGVGIDPNEIDKLFNKFSRTKDANKTNIHGTGLGLYIAKKIVEAHSGDIKISSEGLGKGSTFTIELPLHK
jgi:signal transduction histidine kinase